MAGGFNLAGIVYKPLFKRKQEELTLWRIHYESMRKSRNRWRYGYWAAMAALVVVIVCWYSSTH